MRVPFQDTSAYVRAHRAELDAAYKWVLDSGKFLMGHELIAFEHEFAALCGREYCIGLGSGYDALRGLLATLSLGPEDEVLVPAYGSGAVWNAVLSTPARPRGVDVSENDGNLTVTALQAARTPKAKVVIVPHMHGIPGDIANVAEWCREEGLFCIEEGSQAPGARIEGKPVGSFGDAAVFSFSPGHILSAMGEAGAVVCDRRDLSKQLVHLRGFGCSGSTGCSRLVFSRLEEIQSSFLRVGIRSIPHRMAKRDALAQLYREQIESLREFITVPSQKPGPACSWPSFTIRSANRNSLRKYLHEQGIETLVPYPKTVPRMDNFRSLQQGPFPAAERWAAEHLCLPLHPHLDEKAIQYVRGAVRTFFEIAPPRSDKKVYSLSKVS